MCGRYYIEQDAVDEMFAEYIRQAQARADRSGLKLSCRGEIFPTNIVPVIVTSAAHRTVGAYPMRWGFIHPTRGMQVINTRCETAAEKPLFCSSIHDRRCLIPASCYYEWKKESNGKKTKYVFSRADDAPLFLAGLYLRSSDAKLPCFTILTRDAADGIKSIHNRMPVIIPQVRCGEWLSADCPYTEALQFAAAELEYQTAGASTTDRANACAFSRRNQSAGVNKQSRV